MKKRWLFFGFSLLLALALSACNGETPEENETDLIVAVDGTMLTVRLQDEEEAHDIMDLALFNASEDSDIGEIDIEKGMLYWYPKDNEEKVPLIDIAVLEKLHAGNLDMEDARLKRNVDRLEIHDEESGAWRLLFNFALIHDDYRFDPIEQGDRPRDYQGLGARLPLLEYYGFYDGWAHYEDVPVGKDAYDAERDVHLPQTTWFKRDLIDLDSVVNDESFCQIPGEQYCFGGTLEIHLEGSIFALFESPVTYDFGWNGPVLLTLEVDAIENASLSLISAADNQNHATIDEGGTHTFSVEIDGIQALRLQITGQTGGSVTISGLTVADSEDTLIVDADAPALRNWNSAGGSAERALDDAVGVVASFNYDFYQKALAHQKRIITNQQFDEIMDEYGAVCGEAADHPDDSDNDEMWIYSASCPIREVLSISDEIVFGDDVYYSYETIVRSYLLYGYDRLPYVFFGATVGGHVRLADERIEEVILPPDMEVLQRGAFYQATSLKAVQFPDQLTTIDVAAFQYAESLEELHIPNSVTFIGNTAFHSARSLHTVTLPDGLETIEAMTFAYTESLKTIDLPEGLKTIEQSAFRSSGLKTITLPESLETIGRHAFMGTNLEQIVIPESVTTMNEGVFDHATALEEIVIEGDTLLEVLRSQPRSDDPYGVPIFQPSSTLVIYVADALVDAYRAHPSWQTLSEHIRPMSERTE